MQNKKRHFQALCFSLISLTETEEPINSSDINTIIKNPLLFRLSKRSLKNSMDITTMFMNISNNIKLSLNLLCF